jgi:hypothetical protein
VIHDDLGRLDTLWRKDGAATPEPADHPPGGPRT